jgi:PAS domain S-box-containing protein
MSPEAKTLAELQAAGEDLRRKLHRFKTVREENRRLREGEERYRELVEGTNDLVTVVDWRGRFLYLNHRSRELFGLSPEQGPGLSAFDFVHPDDRDRTREWFAGQVDAREDFGEIENRQVGPAGEVRHLLWTSRFHYDEMGELTHVSIIARDITARKKTEQALETSRARLQALLDSSPQVFILTDSRGAVLTMNATAEGLTGSILNPGLREGELLRNYIPPENLQTFDRLFQAALEGAPGASACEIRDPSGRGRWFSFQFIPVRDTENRVVGIHYNAGEIQERKEAETSLERSGEVYRDLVEETDSLTATLDAEGIFLFLDDKTREVFGISPEEALCRSAFDFVHPDDRDRTREWFHRAVSRGQEIAEIENRQIHRNGEFREFLWSCRFHYNEQGALVKVNTVARDITERK